MKYIALEDIRACEMCIDNSWYHNWDKSIATANLFKWKNRLLCIASLVKQRYFLNSKERTFTAEIFNNREQNILNAYQMVQLKQVHLLTPK